MKRQTDQRLVYSSVYRPAPSRSIYIIVSIFIFSFPLVLLGLFAFVRCFFPLGSVDAKRKTSAVCCSKTTRDVSVERHSRKLLFVVADFLMYKILSGKDRQGYRQRGTAGTGKR